MVDDIRIKSFLTNCIPPYECGKSYMICVEYAHQKNCSCLLLGFTSFLVGIDIDELGLKQSLAVVDCVHKDQRLSSCLPIAQSTVFLYSHKMLQQADRVMIGPPLHYAFFLHLLLHCDSLCSLQSWSVVTREGG